MSILFKRAPSKIIFPSTNPFSTQRSLFSVSNSQKIFSNSRAFSQNHKSPEKITVLDTTLRDGIQSPKARITHEGMIRIAKVLEELNVDYIEAGFPASSDFILNFVQEVTRIVRTPTISACGRLDKGDIEKAAESLKYANKARIFAFIGTSPIHLEHKLKKTEEQVLEKIHDCISYAKTLMDDVCWGAEDGTRSEPRFLHKAIETAINAGANCIAIGDTVGWLTPEESTELFTSIHKSVKNADRATFGIHCHNDLGLAVANSISAIKAGARQIDCTINGIGERAGNTALEELVMAIKMRYNNFYTDIDTTKLLKASKAVEEETHLHVAKNKAIVGGNAFAHESGIHQDGVIKNKKTYEIMDPHSVGHTSTFSVGILSGKAGIKKKLVELGCEDHDNELLDEYVKHFKHNAGKKGGRISDHEMVALYSELKNRNLNQDYRIFFSGEPNQEAPL